MKPVRTRAFIFALAATIAMVSSPLADSTDLSPSPQSAEPGCSDYILVSIRDEVASARQSEASDLQEIARFGGQAFLLGCRPQSQELLEVLPSAEVARQTYVGDLPRAVSDSGVWQPARYVWFQDTRWGFVVEQVIALGSDLTTVVGGALTIPGPEKAGGGLSVRRLDLASGKVTATDVIDPSAALAQVAGTPQAEGFPVQLTLSYLSGHYFWEVIRSEPDGAARYVVDAATGVLLAHYPPVEAQLQRSVSKPPSSGEGGPAGAAGPNRSSSGGTLFVVGVDTSASWRDFSVLAAVPAAARQNNGIPAILVRSLAAGVDPSHTQFESLYSPSETVYVGIAQPGAITGDNQTEIAAKLAEAFWTSAATAVLVDRQDYASALLAAQLGARVDSPLMYFDGGTLPSPTETRLLALGVTSALVIGAPPPSLLTHLQSIGIAATVLAESAAVTDYTADLGDVDYVVITNPRDREYAGWTPRLSLLAPVLAAGRRGIVFPAAYDVEWKVTHPWSAATNSQPAGTYQGSDDFVCYDFPADDPPRAGGATWELHPLQGHFARSSMYWLTGDYPEQRTFYLGASSSGLAAFDRVLIDVNADGFFSDNELFAIGGAFEVNGRQYRVHDLSGNGDPDGQIDHLALFFQTWRMGTARPGTTDYTYAVTCGKASDQFGAFDVAHIDLNHDGNFDDEGEGPFWPGDAVILDAKRYVVTPGHDGSLRLSYPDAREVAAQMWDQVGASGLNPDYVAIVGYYDAVPFGVYRDVSINYEDVSSDIPYGDHDDDTFMDAATGRLFASDVFKASALVARSLTYDDLPGAWREQGLALSNWSLDFPGSETTAKNIERQLENQGVATLGLYEEEYGDNFAVSMMGGKGFIAHFDHGTPMDPWNMRTVTIDPAVGTFWGCSSAWIEGNPMDQNAVSYLDQGGVSYVGNTRLGFSPVSEHAFSLFWNRLLNDRSSVGMVHRAMVNYKILDWLESSAFGDLSTAYRIVQYGDPAVTPSFSSPAIAPAHTQAEGSEPGQRVSYHGPGVWWTDTAHNDAGTTFFAVQGPGIATTGWFGSQYVLDEAASSSVAGVMQMTEVNPPIGWRGNYYFDPGETRRGVWITAPIDYDSSTGEVRAVAPLLEYKWLAPGLFANVGEDAGVTEPGDARAVAWGDYDGDGDLDLYVVAGNRPNRMYRNNGDGTFTEIATQAGVANSGPATGVAAGDYNNDGALDLFVSNDNASDVLYRNNGGGAFTDATAEAGVGFTGTSMAPSFVDYDHDGALDLFVATWGCDLLYHNEGDGTFKEVSQVAGLQNCHASPAATWADYDNDGDEDVYITSFWGEPNSLYRNDGDGTFTEVGAAAGVADTGWGQGAAWGDYNNDGNLDLYVSNSNGNTSILHRNDGNGTFSNVTGAAGVPGKGDSRGALFADFNNDGDLDLYVFGCGQANVLYRNNGNGTFSDVTADWYAGDRSCVEGAAGDYDGNGYLDLYMPRLEGDNRLLRNGGAGNHWLILKTVGTASNRDGIGARISVTCGGHTQIREVQAGTSGGAADSLPVEFGLGSCSTGVAISVRWPSGTMQSLQNVPADSIRTITEPGRYVISLPLITSGSPHAIQHGPSEGP